MVTLVFDSTWGIDIITEQEREVREIFRTVGAVLDGHFVFSHLRHGTTYVSKERLFRFPLRVTKLCKMLAEHFMSDGIEVVVGPAICGAIVAARVAEFLGPEVVAVFAEKDEKFGMATCLLNLNEFWYF